MEPTITSRCLKSSENKILALYKAEKLGKGTPKATQVRRKQELCREKKKKQNNN